VPNTIPKAKIMWTLEALIQIASLKLAVE